MNKPYIAQPGTVAHKALEYMKGCAAGTELSTVSLADAIGVAVNGFVSYMSPLIRYGIVRKRVGDNRQFYWSLNATHAVNEYEPDVGPGSASGGLVKSTSVLAVPSVFAYAETRQADPFSCAYSTDGRMRIERFGRLVLELNADEARVVARVSINGVPAPVTEDAAA